MSYRRHTAREDVLEEPGERDITAHVNFTALEAAGEAAGLERRASKHWRRRCSRRASRISSPAALAAAGEREQLRRRMQLKTLLFGMGETFRVLLQRKTAG